MGFKPLRVRERERDDTGLFWVFPMAHNPTGIRGEFFAPLIQLTCCPGVFRTGPPHARCEGYIGYFPPRQPKEDPVDMFSPLIQLSSFPFLLIWRDPQAQQLDKDLHGQRGRGLSAGPALKSQASMNVAIVPGFLR